MNIIEASKTKRGIRRPVWTDKCWLQLANYLWLRRDDILADDWEVEPEVCKHLRVHVAMTNPTEVYDQCGLCGVRLELEPEEDKHPRGCQCDGCFKERYNANLKSKSPRLLAWICIEPRMGFSFNKIHMFDEGSDVNAKDYERAPWLDQPEEK